MYLAEVESIYTRPDMVGVFVRCAFDYGPGQGRKNPSREPARLFPIEEFLRSMGGGHTIVAPFGGGDHKSMYAQVDGNVESGYSLSPGFRKKWRPLFYGSRYNDDVVRYRDKYVDDRTHPEDRNKPRAERRWKYENAWFVINKDGGDATVDHDPPVVKHFKDLGKNLAQKARVDWYKAGGGKQPPDIMPRSVNSEFGSDDERAAPYEIGEDFRGPGDRS
jgi:hypothetical protein